MAQQIIPNKWLKTLTGCDTSALQILLPNTLKGIKKSKITFQVASNFNC